MKPGRSSACSAIEAATAGLSAAESSSTEDVDVSIMAHEGLARTWRKEVGKLVFGRKSFWKTITGLWGPGERLSGVRNYKSMKLELMSGSLTIARHCGAAVPVRLRSSYAVS